MKSISFFPFCTLLFVPYGGSLVAASSSLSSMNAETLRSLGMSTSEIESILGETILPNDEDEQEEDLEFEITERPTSVDVLDEEDEYSYDEYDESQVDDENVEASIYIDENENEDVNTDETVIDNTPEVSAEEEKEEGEWWKDPFANFEEEKEEKVDDTYDDEYDTDDEVSLDAPSPVEDVTATQVDESSPILEEKLDVNDLDEFSEYSYDELDESEEEQDETIEDLEEEKETTVTNAVEENDESSKRVVPDVPSTNIKGNVGAITIAALPKIGSAIVASPVAVQAFAALVLGNMAFSIVKKSKSKDKKEDIIDATIHENQPVANDDLIYEESDYVYNEDFAFGKPMPSRAEDLEEAVQQMHEKEEAKEEQMKKQKSRGKRWGQKKQKPNDAEEEAVKKSQQRNGFGFRGKRNANAEIHRLLDEVVALKERADTAEQTRDLLEKDVDRAMKQLKEAQKDLREVSQTNTYLKNQLADNKRIMERAVNAERQKLNNEMSKLREQMVQILERERRIMRAQLMKSSAEVRSLIENSIEEDEYEYVEEEE
jgi:hypothetical protein